MEKMMQSTTARFSVSNYKELGHYSSKCLEGNSKANTQGSLKEDLNIITLLQVQAEGTLHKKMHKGRYSKTLVRWNN
jgi:hypothetical protein